jgi:hypothetical protein
MGLINQGLEWLRSGNASGEASAFLKDVWDKTIGNTGFVVTLTNGVTKIMKNINELKAYWNNINNKSKEIV